MTSLPMLMAIPYLLPVRANGRSAEQIADGSLSILREDVRDWHRWQNG